MLLIEEKRELLSQKNFAEYEKLIRRKDVLDVLCIWESLRDQNGNSIDTFLMRIMPVFVKDNIKTLSERYFNTFPEEAVQLRKELMLENISNESGWSDGKTMRHVMGIPEKLYRAIEFIIPNAFIAENLKSTVLGIKSAIPLLVKGNI